MTTLPSVEGILTADQIAETVASIVADQQPDGLVLWSPGGHADPWNHVEAAMALQVGGRRDEAERAYAWMAEHQLADGSWHQYYLADRVKESKRDANTIAYVAAGAWHHYLCTGDLDWLEGYFGVVEKAIDFVLDLQTPRGEILWARHTDGTPWSYALLTGSSSICHSLRCAIACAEAVGKERPDWELSAARLNHCVAHVPDAFAPKHRWAMDWYYPVLGGCLRGDDAESRLEDRWDEFLMPGQGIRCVSDRPWVTAAETCECSMAYLSAGRRDRALQLLEMAQTLRDVDGSYWTGMVFPERKHFPGGERTSYTAAAVVLAADALADCSPAAGLFRDHDALPALLDPHELDLDNFDPLA